MSYVTGLPAIGFCSSNSLEGLDLSPDPPRRRRLSVEHARTVAVGPGGLNLTPFSRLVCGHSDCEIHYVQLNVKVARAQLPLRLAVAAFLRTPMVDGTCPSLTEMAVAAIPEEIPLVLTSGQVLFPFEDSPHITHDGVILHGRSAPQRAMVYRILYQTECLPSPGCAVGLGQARPRSHHLWRRTMVRR